MSEASNLDSRIRVLLIMGTRPELIKMAPLVMECKRQNSVFQPIVCFTGQHREMLHTVAEYFQISPDVSLDIMSPNQSLAALTSRCLQGIDAVIEHHAPHYVVAQGDTSTVLASALAAFYRRVPYVHVEAGLRTRNLYSPWPEEFNRRVPGIVAALHCAPTQQAADNLLAEGVHPQQIKITGNTVIDALHYAVQRERKRSSLWARKYAELGDFPMVLITGHRRENFGAPFESVCLAIRRLAVDFPDTHFVYPVHLNPNIQAPVFRLLGNLPNVHLREPAVYPEFVWLMDRACLILTDSGGVQEEAPSLGKPVLVTRDTTERPEALASGAVKLVGTDQQLIVAAAKQVLTRPPSPCSSQLRQSPYGDGNAAPRIAQLILQHRARAMLRNAA
jgi:UDP-N-acetylglucosamine 2-epimerase (non-hydrolysing)